MTAPKPSRRREESRRAILAATAELVNEVGYPKLTIESIAARAGVGKQTIYRWWPSRGAVVLEVVNELIGTATDFPDTSDIYADLSTQMANVVAALEGPFGVLLRGLVAEAQSDPRLAADLLDTVIMPRYRACQARLEKAKSDGELRADVDTALTVEMLYGPLYYRLLLRTAPLTPGHMATVTSILIGALKAP